MNPFEKGENTAGSYSDAALDLNIPNAFVTTVEIANSISSPSTSDLGTIALVPQVVDAVRKRSELERGTLISATTEVSLKRSAFKQWLEIYRRIYGNYKKRKG